MKHCFKRKIKQPRPKQRAGEEEGKEDGSRGLSIHTVSATATEDLTHGEVECGGFNSLKQNPGQSAGLWGRMAREVENLNPGALLNYCPDVLEPMPGRILGVLGPVTIQEDPGRRAKDTLITQAQRSPLQAF